MPGLARAASGDVNRTSPQTSALFPPHPPPRSPKTRPVTYDVLTVRLRRGRARAKPEHPCGGMRASDLWDNCGRALAAADDHPTRTAGRSQAGRPHASGVVLGSAVLFEVGHANCAKGKTDRQIFSRGWDSVNTFASPGPTWFHCVREFLKHAGLEQVDAVGGSETLRMM